MTAQESSPNRFPPAVVEAFTAWGVSFLAIVLASLLFAGTAIPKLVATASFLYIPLFWMRRRDEDYRDYGATLSNWRQDLKLFLVMCLIVAPVFFVLFYLYVQWVPLLPRGLARMLSPHLGAGDFTPRLPPRFGEWVIDQIFVVALPEEFFYRGYIQKRLGDAWPSRRRILGARIGAAFLVTAILFAVGHLAIFHFWRLAVFFPALLFGWMRERTGTIVAAALFHAFCNLYQMFLEASFFGAR